MKKITYLSIVFAGLAFASCKKDRTCECTMTNTIPGSSATTTKQTIIGASKRQAMANCVSWTTEETIGGTKFTFNADCTLK